MSSHPVQYAAPLYRLYSADPRLDVTVAYCSLQGAERGVDPEFGVEIAWDVPLLDGYRWIHPPNRSPRPSLHGFWGLLNPGLWKLIREQRFDLVVCYGWRAASFWIAALAAKVSGSALVLSTDAHTLAPRDGARWKVPVKRVVLPLFFKFADAVFGPSTRTLSLLRSLAVPAERLFLTHYVVDNAFFARRAHAADRRAVRRSWSVPEETCVALFVGKLVPWKRPGDVLEAAGRGPDIHVVLAGEGPERRALEARARRPDLEGRVHFIGFVNQGGLPRIYMAADVLVLPSSHEPFGLVVNEAFACGLPAIVSEACGAAGDLVRDGETGYIVPVGNVEILADRLGRLAFGPELRRAFGERARARVADWGLNQNAEAFTKACLTIVARRNGRVFPTESVTH